MSIIERAAEKLRVAQKPTTGESRPPEAPAPRNGTSRERSDVPSTELLGERILEADQPAPVQAPAPSLKVDFTRLRASGVAPPEAARESLEDDYRRVKRPLLANITGRGVVKVDQGQFILITSALSGEGKTFSAFNLARSLAQETDWEVVLVDGDNARRSLTHALGTDNAKGLIDLLGAQDVQVEDLMLSTDIAGLYFLPAGNRHAQATEYFSSQRMERVLTRLGARRNRIVLFDSPPVLESPDALVLAEAVGQIVMVVKAGSTERKAVTAAVQSLDKKKAINLLLNQVMSAHGDRYSRYHYGYYGGSPADEQKPGRDRASGG